MDGPHIRTMKTLTLAAPAKLNLSLRVLRKRDDGFHEIDTLMVQLPGLADHLEFREANKFTFTCDDPVIPADETNLVVKAVRAYESAAAISCSFAIHLKKIIPHGAGLGGGSSNAATTLLGLDQLHDGKLGPTTLRKIASTLGSDVPFFLQSLPARCTGRGEIIEPTTAPSISVILFKPMFEVKTPDAYGQWNQSFEISRIAYHEQVASGLTLCNDLERPVFSKHRFLAEFKQWLLARHEVAAALMTGSGSTVFAVLQDGADPDSLARAAHHELDPTLWTWSGMTAGNQ